MSSDTAVVATPQPTSSSTALTVSNTSTALTFPKSNSLFTKAKRKAVVLPEEEYVETIDHIIQRDFFPALPVMERLLRKRKPGGELVTPTPSGSNLASTPSVAGTPTVAKSAPPVSAYAGKRAPSSRREGGDDWEPMRPSSPGPLSDSLPVKKEQNEMPPPPPKKQDLPLNKFLSGHTSEDNDSFTVLMHEQAERNEEKYFWVKEQVNAFKNAQADPKRNGLLDYGEFHGRQALMFYPTGEGVVQNIEVINPLPEKVISYENTRFPGALFQAPKKEFKEHVDTASANAGGLNVGGGTPAVGGYKFLRTPSPAPGSGGASPFVTWGDIIGTPLHLSEEDELEKAAANGPTGPIFKVPATPSRDQVAHRLSDKAKKDSRLRMGSSASLSSSTKAKQRATPSPSMKTPYSPYQDAATKRAMLSPAARRLVTGQIKAGKTASSVDTQLKRSYTPKRSRPNRPTSTPRPSDTPTPQHSAHSTPTR